jgi:hypothetical protein
MQLCLLAVGCLTRPPRDKPPRAPEVKLSQWAAEPRIPYPSDPHPAHRLPHPAPARCNPFPFAAALKRGARSVAPNPAARLPGMPCPLPTLPETSVRCWQIWPLHGYWGGSRLPSWKPL